jgi:hypothetical protein
MSHKKVRGVENCNDVVNCSGSVDNSPKVVVRKNSLYLFE